MKQSWIKWLESGVHPSRVRSPIPTPRDFAIVDNKHLTTCWPQLQALLCNKLTFSEPKQLTGEQYTLLISNHSNQSLLISLTYILYCQNIWPMIQATPSSPTMPTSAWSHSILHHNQNVCTICCPKHHNYFTPPYSTILFTWLLHLWNLRVWGTRGLNSLLCAVEDL